MANKRKPRSPDEVVIQFVRSVYPELGELGLISGTEESILTDATEVINELRARVKELEMEEG